MSFEPAAWARDWMLDAAQWIALVVIVTGLAQTAFYLVQLVYAAIALHHRPPVPRGATLWRGYSDQAPPIALIALNVAFPSLAMLRALGSSAAFIA